MQVTNLALSSHMILGKKIRKQLTLSPSKLAHKDSNLEMTESESVALPFGDGPINMSSQANSGYYIGKF